MLQLQPWCLDIAFLVFPIDGCSEMPMAIVNTVSRTALEKLMLSVIKLVNLNNKPTENPLTMMEEAGGQKVCIMLVGMLY